MDAFVDAVKGWDVTRLSAETREQASTLVFYICAFSSLENRFTLCLPSTKVLRQVGAVY